MVMHARKLPRLNDGYSAKSGYDEMLVHGSPNGKSSYRRSISPDSRSQSPRYSSSKSSYHRDGRLKDYRDQRDHRDRHRGSENSPRDRDRDRYRDRDRDRDRERDRDRDRDRDSSRSSYDRAERDRSETRASSVTRVVRREERVSRVGAWTEHVSSSGKRYYYNANTEVSQWDKPREWLDAERRGELREPEPPPRASVSSAAVAAAGTASSTSSSSSAAASAAAAAAAAADPKSGYDRVSGGRRDSGERNRDREREQRPHRERAEQRERTRRRSDEPPSSSHRANGQPQRAKRAARSRRRWYRRRRRGRAQDMDISSGDSTPTEESAGTGAGAGPGAARLSGLTVSLSAALPGIVASAGDTPPPEDRGPPTPTLSEPQDSAAATAERRPDLASPPVQCSSIRGVQPTALSALRPAAPQLTAAHAQHFREELIQHVLNWPATVMEKQANRTNEEACHVASLLMTKAATDLKMARSLVRLAEIQATLQEQRILFLRQQIHELDELKSQNSFMSDT